MARTEEGMAQNYLVPPPQGPAASHNLRVQGLGLLAPHLVYGSRQMLHKDSLQVGTDYVSSAQIASAGFSTS